MENVLTEYSLGERVHQSGRTIVYRAVRLSDQAACILKIPQNEHPPPSELERLEREYQTLEALHIDGVIRPYALARYKSRLALVMEDFGGVSLRQTFATRRATIDEVLDIGSRVARALGQVHQQRVVHKDINPANVVRNPETGQVKIIDFGIARTPLREATSLRKSGVFEGTLLYMSPEQTGRMNQLLDYRADLYSLGVMLYELLAGDTPFRFDDTLALMHAHIALEPAPLHDRRRDMPRALSDVVHKLLSKTPDKRHQSGRGLALDLETLRAELAVGGTMEGFVPGKHDVSTQFQLPQKLYGRETAAAQLSAVFERVVAGATEIVLISGYSGIGKTSLVSETCVPLVAARGYFATGRFEQLRRNIPYASLVDAFHEIIRHILAESEEGLARWREKLIAALGRNAPVIAELIPNLELVIGKQPPAMALAPKEALNRFNFAFQNFVRAFAAREHPLVLYLDDLQWADPASLNLVQELLTDPEVRHFCIIGAYRDNEVAATHPLMDMLDVLRSGGTQTTSITLAPLAVEHIVHLIDDALHCGADRATPLANLLFQKTEGNPFFLGQLLSSLVNDGLIEFDSEAGTYRWEVENIRAFGITRDIVELMVGKIQKLAPRTQTALELAACIGNRFDVRTLSVILRCPPAEAAAALQQAIDEGLLLPLEMALLPMIPATDLADTLAVSSFRFLHDRVRHAAYSLLPEKKRADVHLELARFFLSSSPEAALDEHIFDIVNQYMLGIDGISSREERYRVARLALRASRKAKSAAAFEPALRYSMTGLQLLPENAFDREHTLAVELYTDGAETEYLNAHMEAAQQLADIAMKHSRTTVEKVNVLETRMLFNLSGNKFEDVIRHGLDALALLDVHLPSEPTRDDFTAALERNRIVLGDRAIADLALLPETTTESELAIQRILVLLAAPAKTANPILFLIVATEHLHQCVLRGNSRFAPIAYATYGVLHASVLADANAALAWGELAATVLERLTARQAKSNVYLLLAVLIKPWKVHLRETLPLLREGLAAGIDAAELQFAGHCASNSCTSPLIAALPLDDVLKKQAQHVEFLTRVKHDMLRLFASIPQQTVLNLTGHSEDPSKLVGAAFDEDISTPALVQAKNFSSLCVLYTCKSLLAYLFGHYALAVTFAEQAEANRHGLMGHPMLILQNEFQSLALLAYSRELPEAERGAALSTVERNQSEMAGWARNAPMNFLHKWQLIEAERARILGRAADAMEFYESAIRHAAQENFIYDEAMACERASDACRAWGWARASESYLVDAHYAYLRWGATAKVTWLEQHHPEKLGSRALFRDLAKTETISSQTPSTGSNEVLELTSVMKASQAISSEIVLDRLVHSLLKIMLENAGARRGFFLLMRDGRLVIEAECLPDQTETLRGGMTLAENEARMSAAIVNYVARTGETIVLSNAAEAGHFTKDPYVLKAAPKSILCAPLTNQGQITGVIYLENNLTEGAFTAERLEVLRLLSGQAALSIHNAKLYATLEQKVEERTRELREKNEELRATQKELVTKEKLASLGSLTAGIAHELKNPLNFINNFAGLSVQLVEELNGEFEGQRGTIDDDALETMTEAFDLLRQNVEKIENHGKRANRIISSMLQHSRNTVGERGPTELNAVVAENVTYSVQGAQNRDPTFKIEVIAQYDPSVALIDAVAGDVGRVVLSIVENACYAAAQKKRALGKEYQPELRVTTTGEADHVEIRIKDNGTGIRPDAVDKIFMPFFTTKPPGEGTGLGLSLSHDIIVEGHRGSLSLNTRTGEFTEFIIRLPRRVKVEN